MHRYENVRLLGHGGYGSAELVRVVEASHERWAAGDGRLGGDIVGEYRVVKKVPLSHFDAERRNDAFREVSFLKSLQHPNIIGYDDAIFAGGMLCIVMEYAGGGDLAGKIKERVPEARLFQETEVISFFSPLVFALQYIHNSNILHRDLKSANIFLTADGTVKIGDFGVARVLNSSDSAAVTCVGSPSHLPPELCRNEPYGFKADVWCLGVILYEMLGLRLPFRAANILAVAVQICGSEPEPVSAVYSSELRDLLAGMLKKTPDDRISVSEIVKMPNIRQSNASKDSPSKDRLDVDIAVTLHPADAISTTDNLSKSAETQPVMCHSKSDSISGGHAVGAAALWRRRDRQRKGLALCTQVVPRIQKNAYELLPTSAETTLRGQPSQSLSAKRPSTPPEDHTHLFSTPSKCARVKVTGDETEVWAPARHAYAWGPIGMHDNSFTLRRKLSRSFSSTFRNLAHEFNNVLMQNA